MYMTPENEPIILDEVAVTRANLDTAELRLAELAQHEPKTALGRGVQRVKLWAARGDALEAEAAFDAAVDGHRYGGSTGTPIA
jgi:uncharacterized protein HemY